MVEVSGAGDFEPKVGAKIRRFKEVYRSVNTSLAWELPPSLVKDLVAYTVPHINI
jgi:hypothetical protein